MKELAYTGRKMNAEEAVKSGLINAMYKDKSELINNVYKVAKDIAKNSPIAVSGTKQIIKYSLNHSIDDGLEYAALWNSSKLQSLDFIEAVKAQIEKREAIFDDILPTPNLSK
jgi:enoyl-CoA hydratase